jgi:AraC-like DNA-binding protein
MEIFYTAILFFIIYFSLGIFLLVKNGRVSNSSIYLGLFFLSISGGSLSICFFILNLDNYFIFPFLLFQSHIIWFYYYLNAVIGNKISKINFYSVIFCFAISFVLTLYVSFQLFTNALIVLEENLFPFQKNNGDLFIWVSKISFGYKIFLSVLLFIYSWKLLKDFKSKGFTDNSSKDLYKWLNNIVLILILFSISRIGIFYSVILSKADINSVNSYFFIFTQLLLLLISFQIFKYPLISIGIPISRRFYKPDIYAIDQTTRSYLFDLTIMNQKILDWEDTSTSYLNMNFNLSKFAKEIEVDELEINYYLNEYKEISFQEYLNFLRISFVIVNIEQNYLKEHSVTKLAEDAGFSDRTSLEKTFKKIINVTLQEFIDHE